MTDKSGQTVFQNADNGERYPLVREADDSDLVHRAQAVLASGIPQEALKLDRFARHGFWLQSADGKRELVMFQYVDLAVGESGVEDGTLEEIFPHELAHLILRSVFGERFTGPSVKMHQSMSVTDYQTAFDEGYAEHFQTLIRDNTHNPHLQALTRGVGAADLDLFWLSRVDQQLRTDGIKRNLFVHRKSIPASALDGGDPYLVFTDSETSPDFLHDELKSGQEMMASEGVISTLFYRMVNDDRLRNAYCDPGFYQSFFAGGLPPDTRTAVTAYENVNLKLFAAMRQVALRANLDGPLVISIVDKYTKLFPNEADAIYDDFLSTTYGATASQETVNAFEKALRSGRRGDIQNFRADSRAAFAALSSLEEASREQATLGCQCRPRALAAEPRVQDRLRLLAKRSNPAADDQSEHRYGSRGS